MQVFDGDHDWLRPREPEQPLRQSRQQAPVLLIRCRQQRRITRGHREV